MNNFLVKFDLPQESSLKPGEELGKVFDLAILGGGPAGMTAGIYASRKQMNTVLISLDMGGQVAATMGVENYMGFQYINGSELAEKFSTQLKQFPLNLILEESISQAAQAPDNLFTVRTNQGRILSSRSLVIATGKRWRRLGVPGEEAYQGKGVAYCSTCDAPLFKGLAIAVVGGGNSAAGAALDLLALGCQVTLVNVVAGWQADPVLLERLQGRADLLDRRRVLEVLGDGRKVTGLRLGAVDNAETVLPVRGVFVEIGMVPNTEPFQGFVELNEKQEILVDCATRTSRPGVYGAGDCTNVPDKQIIIAAGEGAKAALAAYRYNLFTRLPLIEGRGI